MINSKQILIRFPLQEHIMSLSWDALNGGTGQDSHVVTSTEAHSREKEITGTTSDLEGTDSDGALSRTSSDTTELSRPQEALPSNGNINGNSNGNKQGTTERESIETANARVAKLVALGSSGTFGGGIPNGSEIMSIEAQEEVKALLGLEEGHVILESMFYIVGILG
jgi:hypothetical protein